MPEASQIINYLLGGFLTVGILVIAGAGFIWNVLRNHKKDIKRDLTDLGAKNEEAHEKIGDNINETRKKLSSRIDDNRNALDELKNTIISSLLSKKE